VREKVRERKEREKRSERAENNKRVRVSMHAPKRGIVRERDRESRGGVEEGEKESARARE